MGLLHGKEILATYGPLGFLGLPFYHPATFLFLIIFNVLVYSWVVFRLIGLSRILGEKRYGLRVCLVLLPLALSSTFEWAPVLFVPYVLVLMYCLDLILSGWRLGWRTATAYAILFAAFTLLKLTFIPLILGVVVLCTFFEAMQGSMPKTLAIYAAVLGLLWFSSGQSITNIGAFLLGVLQVVSGYKDAMGTWIMATKVSAIPLVAAQAALWLAAAGASWRIGKLAALVISGVLFLVLYSILLNGYIRGDGDHALPSILATLSVSALLAPLIKSAQPYRWLRLATALRVTFLSSLLALLFLWLSDGFRPVFHQFVDRPMGLGRLMLRGTSPLHKEALASVESLRSQTIPGLQGMDVDVRNGDPGVAIVSGANLRLRPTITSYSAFTPQLAQANADFLENPRGPEAILLTTPLTLEGKYPTIEDSYSWISVLSHYQQAGSFGNCELFKRRASPRKVQLVPLSSTMVGLGEEMTVPHDDNRAIWAEIDVTPTITGRLLAAAFQPIPVFMTATLEDGSQVKTRIILQMAKAGFLLSPYLNDARSLRSLAGSDVAGERSLAVKSFKIDRRTPNSNIDVNIFYNFNVAVKFFSLHLDGKAMIIEEQRP